MGKGKPQTRLENDSQQQQKGRGGRQEEGRQTVNSESPTARKMRHCSTSAETRWYAHASAPVVYENRQFPWEGRHRNEAGGEADMAVPLGAVCGEETGGGGGAQTGWAGARAWLGAHMDGCGPVPMPTPALIHGLG